MVLFFEHSLAVGVIVALLIAATVFAVVFALCWAVLKSDVGGAFGVGGFVVTVATLLCMVYNSL